MKRKYIKIKSDFFKKLDFKLTVPTFMCSCGEEVLDTPNNREQSQSSSGMIHYT